MPDPARYPAEVFWSDEDEGFIAIAPDLPGCSAFGIDEVTALAELRTAITAWIEAATSAGNHIPEPSRPKGPEQVSGKFLLRVPRTLHSQLIRGAKAEDISLNSYVVYLLTEAVAQRSAGGSRSAGEFAEVHSASGEWSPRLQTLAEGYLAGPGAVDPRRMVYLPLSGGQVTHLTSTVDKTYAVLISDFAQAITNNLWQKPQLMHGGDDAGTDAPGNEPKLRVLGEKRHPFDLAPRPKVKHG